MYQWISWHQPTEDVRPLTYPPGPKIMGWWCSGSDHDDVPILCAMVKASSEREAKEAVTMDWPEAKRWRFCDARESPVVGGRFVPTDWMLERCANS